MIRGDGGDMKMKRKSFEFSFDLCDFVNSRKIPKKSIIGIVYEIRCWVLFYYE